MYTNTGKLSSVVVAEPGESYQSKTTVYRWIEVLVDCPGSSELFTYEIPPQLEIKPGDILTVPFGAQQVGAIAIRFLSQPPADLAPEKIREVEDVVSRKFFHSTYWELLNRIATYYYTPLIQVIRVALPPGLLGRSQRRLRLTSLGRDQDVSNNTSIFMSPTAQQVLSLLQKTPTGDYSYYYIQQKVKSSYRGIRELTRLGLAENYLEPPRQNQPKLQKAVTLIDNNDRDLTTRQREIIEVLRRQGGELWQSELLQICSASNSILKTLVEKGYVVIEEREILRREQSPLMAGDQAKSLTNAQTNALELIQSLNGFAQVLLHGVTGSGKTEVYLQAIAPLLNQGKSALVLVPEIGLTPQLTDRFRARFGNRVQVYHSALSDGERYDTWRQMFTGEPQVVIGTRSAIFAPLPNLGLIILDEEHDSSFKQDSPIPTYHARTVAQWRAELEHCPLILGSATPSLESWVSLGEHEKEGGREKELSPLLPAPCSPSSYYLSLPERINSRPLPPVEIVDMRRELQEGNRSIFSRSLQEALEQLQEKKQQGILFIHRRGHSTFVSCRSCGYVLECPHCDVSLAYHHVEEGAPQLLRCHYCNYGRSHPPHCPECSSPYLKFFGSGTQRVAQELNRQFPNLKLIRFDSDTTRNKGAHRNLLTQFANGEADLLVGTQMLTKGLDLPQVTLVGVVAADGLLHLSDYRANERTFQTLTQVAGRAGRGEDPGRVIVQTYTPEHPVIAAVQKHDYHSFSNAELEQREALNYPPYGRLILLRLSSLDPIQVQNTAQIIATTFSDQEGFEILGPAPASILRVANRYRWQILLKFDHEALPNLPDWQEIRALCPPSISLTIDVDPVNIM
ncbi:primosomal protein N' [Anabaena cylindrica FACHB-243]|uniref:Replication restart protein PriA n=1 Tax=Anabaena cylindrica (strain ATCC 27899 / PCC 7122) TaxID=272123 RepID=K9ZA28_ANACC|nr:MULTISPECIES: primosomal protein N' [Anabaena]AFZ56036.1 replication restart DNA helicase PriA [Anabaena cylindrica PCC 7122]MBD2419627.1 primosomal protein N' [Anabaena cylindrica FACHB-243]MBY5284307.1 primosomal protein N' [Anabaena sp. CCAP 1446/1C]MBY5307479.1 primosomal protein N' [Anabaena sp. CCAP 1446/1C]MCM2408253.1 primosomal protein N' [Anabaena sp. CCAP 1446/1C]